MALLIVKLVIWFICLFIAGTLVAVMVRRLYMRRRYQHLDAERERMSHVLDMLSADKRPDESLRRHPAGSAGWLAMEEVLFKGLDSGADAALVLEWFEGLGYVDHYISTLGSSRNKWDRALSAKKLGLIRCKRAVPALIKAISAPYRDTRNMAIFALGLIRDNIALPHLMDSLRDSVRNDEELSIKIVKSSIMAFGECAVPYLIKEARNPLWKTKAAVIDILVELADPRAAETFIGLLDDTEQDVRAKACKGLGKLRWAKATARLIKATEDPYWVVRLHAVKSLGLIGDPFAVEFLGKRLEDQNWQVRKTAAEALGLIGRCAYPVLLDVFLRSTDRFAKEQALDELERAGVMKGFIDYAIALPDSVKDAFGRSSDEEDRDKAQDKDPGPEDLLKAMRPPPGIYLSIAVVLENHGPYRAREGLEVFGGGVYTQEALDHAAQSISRIKDVLGGT